jgi:hypothetical protein
MAEALRTGRSVRNAEIIIEKPDRAKIWVLANIQPIRDDSGQLIGGQLPSEYNRPQAGGTPSAECLASRNIHD